MENIFAEKQQIMSLLGNFSDFTSSAGSSETNEKWFINILSALHSAKSSAHKREQRKFNKAFEFMKKFHSVMKLNVDNGMRIKNYDDFFNGFGEIVDPSLFVVKEEPAVGISSSWDDDNDDSDIHLYHDIMTKMTFNNSPDVLLSFQLGLFLGSRVVSLFLLKEKHLGPQCGPCLENSSYEDFERKFGEKLWSFPEYMYVNYKLGVDFEMALDCFQRSILRTVSQYAGNLCGVFKTQFLNYLDRYFIEMEYLSTLDPNGNATPYSSVVMRPQMFSSIIPSVQLIPTETQDELGSVIEKGHQICDAALKVFPRIEQHSGDLSTILDTLKSLTSKENVLDMLTKANLSVEQCIASVNEQLSSGLNFAVGGFCVVGLTASIIYVVLSPDKFSYSCLAITSMLGAYFHREIASSLLKVLEPYRSGMRPQNGGTMESLVMSITSCLVGASFIGAKKTDIARTVLEHLKNFSTIKKTLNDIVSWVFGLLESFFLDRGIAHYMPMWMRRMNVNDVEIREIFVQHDTIMENYNNNKLPISLELASIVQDLHTKMTNLLRELPINTQTSIVRDALKIELPKLNKLLEICRAARLTADGKRVEPAFFVFAGAPGNFKSQNMELLIANILKEELDDKAWEDSKSNLYRYVYKREAIQGFWDGYKEQMIVLYDDLGQMRVNVGDSNSEVVDIMSAVNEFPWSLWMAHLDNKGNTWFKAKYMLATTNMAKINTETIFSSKAFCRRIAGAFYQIPMPKYCTPETKSFDYMSRVLDKNHPDLEKGPEGEILTCAKYHSLFVRYNPNDPHEIYGEYTFDQMVDYVIQEGKNRERFYKQKVFELEKIYSQRVPDFKIQSGNISMTSLEDLFSDEEDIEDTELNLERELIFPDPKYRVLYNKAVTFATQGPKTQQDVVFCSKLNILQLILDQRGFKADTLMPAALMMVKCLNAFDKQFFFLFNPKVDCEKFACSLARIFDVSPEKYLDSRVYVSHTESTFKNDMLNSLKCLWDTLSNGVCTPFGRALKKTYEIYQENKILILASLAIVGSLATAATVISSVVPRTEHVEEEEKDEENTLCIPMESMSSLQMFSGGSGKSNGKHKQKSRLKTTRTNSGVQWTYETQMGAMKDPQTHMTAKTVQEKNLLVVEWKAPGMDDYDKLGVAIIIKDRIVMCPKHFYEVLAVRVKENASLLKGEILLSFASTNEGHTIKFPLYVGDFLKSFYFDSVLSAKDIALFVLPRDASRNFKNILNRFATVSEHASLKEYFGFLYGVSFVGNKRSTKVETAYFQAKPVSRHPVSGDKIGSYTVSQAYYYAAPTEEGDCGTPLYFYCKYATSRIFGIHVAGWLHGAQGLSAAVAREELEHAISKINVSTIIQDDEFKPQSLMNISNGQFSQVYQVDHRVNAANKTKIVPSHLYNMWGPATTKPAHLRPFLKDGIEIDPRAIAMGKYCGNGFLMSENMKTILKHSYSDFLHSVSEVDVDRRIYSFDESILGLPDDPDYGSLARNTSPGYPHILNNEIRKVGGRRFWFGKDQDYDMDNQRVRDLRDTCDAIIFRAKQGERCEHVFIDCLKDERRPIDKVDIGKTRLFSVSPLEYLIVTRQYFGAFSNWFMKNRINNGSAIGVNPYGIEWDTLARKLKQFGENNMGAGDYSAFDGSERPIIHYIILDVINEWYDDGVVNARIREVLWAELVNSKHIYDDITYCWDSSLPSGHPLTAMINSMYNHLALRAAWCFLHDNDPFSLTTFDENVYVCVLGDDNIFSVSDTSLEIFNEMSLCEALKQFGLTYTTELKDKATTRSRRLEEVSFLKRSFRYDPVLARYVGPKEIVSTLEVPYWTKEHEHTHIVKSNVDITLIEIALHGEEIFNEWAPKIISSYEEIYNVKVERKSYIMNLMEAAGTTYYF